MRLYVFVVEARGLPPASSSAGGAYARLRLGHRKSATRTVRRCSDPAWNEEFVFRVGDEGEGGDLEIAVFRELSGGGGGELVGGLRIPISGILTGALPPTWLPLEPEFGAGGDVTTEDCGKILLSISLYGERSNNTSAPTSPYPSFYNDASTYKVASTIRSHIPQATDPTITNMDESMATVEKIDSAQATPHLGEGFVTKNEETSIPTSRNPDSSKRSNGKFSGFTFEEVMELMQSRDETSMPGNLHGGLLLEQTYLIEYKDMNALLFEQNSQLRKDVSEHQGNKVYHEEPWAWDSSDRQCLKRRVTYTKAATKVFKSVKAIEEQTYLIADGKNFAVLTCVDTPDVPYGSCFEVHLLYKIMPASRLSSSEECCLLVISWEIKFVQSTMMRSVIVGTAQQGLKESFEKFADMLAQYVKPVSSTGLQLPKERLLAPLEIDHQSDWELAVQYLCNFTIVSTVLMGLYVLLHILLSGPTVIQGLEFAGLDLPDTFGELFTSGILVLQGERLLNMFSHFVQARLQRGSDHGVKAQGDGWLLTVALIEANNLPSVASPGFSDPYVVFSCNGKTRTSSVQLQTLDPQWNEILEFDAMQEPPSVLDVEIFDFEGPFDLAVPLGHAEINFLKHTSDELADIWIPLEGKLAQTSQSKLHLRIFLENSKGDETVREYLTRMEKEVGKKLNLRSPQRNSTFQKIFGLPPEEFLVNDYTCYLKRKIPLQGRLFLSARIVGFYGNLFGYKIKFYFLWEDIEDIQVISPSLATVGSPALLMILRSSRGLDARHGAKSLDEEGRLRFQFQAFMSFNIASRTIMALWRTRALTSEQNAKLEEDHLSQGEKISQIEDADSSTAIEDDSLSEAYSAEFSVPMESLMEIFGGSDAETKTMEKVGCLHYSVSPWESGGPDSEEEIRHVSYRFNRQISIFGGEVSSAQQKSPAVDGNGWIVDEVMTLHNVPFGDNFQVLLRYKLEDSASVNGTSACRCNVLVGIRWMKSSRFKKRITKNVCDKLARRCKEMFELAESEILSTMNPQCVKKEFL